MTLQCATSTRGLECVPPRAQLSAKYKDTFAYPTIKDRCPVILCKVIDHLHRERNNIARDRGEECRDGIKKVVEELSKLRYEMQTSKPIVDIVDGQPSITIWNAYLKSEKDKSKEICSWFSSAWLWVECYMYRRINQAVYLSCPSMRDLDVFQQWKESGFHSSIPSMQSLASWFLTNMSLKQTNLSHTWHTLLQVCLWGNKCDLSISAGGQKAATGDPVEALEYLSSKILTNHSSDVWDDLKKREGEVVVDIVMDNSGFELFTDLCLADFLCTAGITSLIRLRVKDQPWFVSDTTKNDFYWSIQQLMSSTDPELKEIGKRWNNHLETGHWTLLIDSFWTYPHCFSQMATVDTDLYNSLSQAHLIIFKGDLNYRKLVGDKNWETCTSFKTSLDGFLPAPILALRTAKADVMVGLEAGQAEETTKEDQSWMVNGEWAVIQFAKP